MERFAGKTVVITGGSTGIGAASARRFHSEGANVVIADVNAEAGEALAAKLGDRAGFWLTDVSDFSNVETLIQYAVGSFGRIDVLFNNAGIGCLGMTPDLPIEDWKRVIAIDLDSVFYGCKAAIPHMREHGGGVILNTASISGMGADYALTAYNAAKGGVINYTRALALDHAQEGIRVLAICPGPIATPLLDEVAQVPEAMAAYHAALPMGRWGEPEEIAGVAAFLASDDASYMTGAAIPLDGGITAHTGQPNLGKIAAAVAAATQ